MHALTSPRTGATAARRAMRFAFALVAALVLTLGLVACGGDPTPVRSIGGSVSGLSSDGLVLSDGSATVAVPSGATSFMFATGLAEGTSYAVTAQAQPAGATCSVGNASGTVGSSAVTNVQVTCIAAAFSIGGTISGLTGAGLVIANGGDQVGPAAGATSFVFANRLAAGASFTIAIAQQPAGQDCSVSGSYPAVVGSSDVSDIAISCVAHVTSSVSFVGNESSCAYADGSGASAGFRSTLGNGVFDAAGNLYVADTGAQVIRKTTPQGVVSTLAGQTGVAGFADGTGAAAAFHGPTGLAIDSGGRLYVADNGNGAIRVVVIGSGAVTTLVGSPAQKTGVPGDGPGASATFFGPVGVAVDAAGYVYFTENGYWLRRVAPNATHDVSLYAGTYGATGAADGTRATATFGALMGLAFDASDNLLLADHGNNNVRRIATDGTVSTLAGSTSGAAGYLDATGSAALFDNDQWLATDGAGNAYVSDLQNFAIRKVTPAGVVTTVLRNTVPFVRLQAFPNGLEVDGQGNVDVEANCSIVRISP